MRVMGGNAQNGLGQTAIAGVSYFQEVNSLGFSIAFCPGHLQNGDVCTDHVAEIIENRRMVFTLVPKDTDNCITPRQYQMA